MLLSALVAVFFFVSISTSEPSETECCPCRPIVKAEEREINSTEGQNVTIKVEGDFYGAGCKFLFQIQEKDKNITCCYKHKFRERKGLCDNLTQPQACRKQDEYDVQEIEGAIGWCTLTLFDGKQIDSGLYRVVFPDDRNRKVRERIVNVNKLIEKGWKWWQVLVISIVIILVLFLFVMYSIFRISKLMEQDGLNRSHDEDILKLLIESKFDELEVKLDGRNILGLRDRNYNNIFHMAAGPEWTEEMTKSVLKIRLGNKELEDSEAPLTTKMIFNLVLKKNILVNFPDKMVPNFMLHQNINLNTRNLEGNTPLIIAAKSKQLHVLNDLLEKNIKLDIQNNDGYTALHKAVQKDHIDVVNKLLEQKAKQEPLSDKGKTPLHTAIENNSNDIVALLVDDLEKGGNAKIRGRQTEPPLFLAIKLGFYDVAKHLLEKGYDEWHTQGVDKEETVYKLVAAGRRDILKSLIGKDKLKWTEFQRPCLLMAINKPNKQAVNNIFRFSDDQKPTEEDRKYALEKAYGKLSDLKQTQEEIQRFINETDENGSEQAIQLKKKLEKNIEKVENIIEKLKKAGLNSTPEDENSSNEPVNAVNEDEKLMTLKNQKKEKMTEYFDFIKLKLKDAKKGQIWKDRVVITKFFQDFDEDVNPIISEIQSLDNQMS